MRDKKSQIKPKNQLLKKECNALGFIAEYFGGLNFN